MKADLNGLILGLRKHVLRSYYLYNSVQRSVSAAESSKYRKTEEIKENANGTA